MKNNFGIKYWKTQIVLKRKWLLEKWPLSRTNDFQRFVILCDPRTGSTWLHTLLNSSRQIMSYGELLTERQIPYSLEKTIWHNHHQSIKAVGCKIFYEQLIDPQNSDLLNEIIENQSIKIIDLTRSDKVECFVSLKIAEKNQIWSANAYKSIKDKKVSINIEELEQFVLKQEKHRRSILDILENHHLYSTTYEQLINNSNSELEDIQSFLGVEPFSMFSLLKKQNPESLKSLISNFDEIESDLKRITPLSEL